MATIDISDLLSNVELHSASPDAAKSLANLSLRMRTAKNKVEQSLGDGARFSNLPDELNDDFVEKYSEGIEQVLVPYIASQMMTLQQATDYRSALVDTIFGNEKHLGMYFYLNEKESSDLKPSDIVQKIEQLLLNGWKVEEENNRYHIVGPDYTKIMDITGTSPLYKATTSVAFDEQTAHLFLPPEAAAQIAATAEYFGQDADALAAAGNLELLLAKVTDREIFGYIVNYGKFRNILRKGTSYTITRGGQTIDELYEEGYRLSSKLVATDAAIIEHGSKEYAMLPIEEGITEGVNKYLLSNLASQIKKDLMPSLVIPEVIEIEDMNKAFAVMAELFPEDYAGATFTDTYNVMQHVRTRSELAMLVALEVVLLGNSRFGMTSFVSNGISKRLYSHQHLDYFTREFKVASMPEDSISSFNDGEVTWLLRYLPDEFISRVSKYEVDVSRYPYDLEFVVERFNRGREVLV